MSVKVLSVSYMSVARATEGKPHIFEGDVQVFVNVLKSDVLLKLIFNIKSGFKCDGASIPLAFRWFLPSWDKKNHIYNLGSAIHDGLYIHKGFMMFTREECDDILRGIWRESGISRFKAGVADKVVQLFAGGKKHWGNDSYGVRDLVSVYWHPMKEAD